MALPRSEKAEFNQSENAMSSQPASEISNINLIQTKSVVAGTTQLYRDGELRLIPRPSSDPKDPLNLVVWKKFMVILTLCFFGAISIATQQIVGSLLPVFVKEYATPMPPGASGSAPAGGASAGFTMPTNPSAGGAQSGGAINPNPLAGLANFPGAPPLWKINLLSSVPLLIVGVSNYFLVPMSIIFGRRPVIIFCATLSWVCGIWAGKSHSLNEHIAARSIQAIGAGAIESLIPFIVQDITFIHQRSRAIGIIWASQGIVTLSLGIGSTYIVDRMSWRWLYFILGIIGSVAWVMVIFFVPETRWIRSTEDLRGASLKDDSAEVRPTLDYERYGRRTIKDDLTMFQGGLHLKAGFQAIIEIAQSLFFPNVFLVVLLNAAFIGISLASSQVLSPVLLAPPYNWPLSSFGLSVIGVFIASVFVWLIGGVGADMLSNYMTKRRGGIREPEVHLYNLIFPIFVGIIGCIMFGAGGTYTNKVSWACIVLGLDFLNFGFLTINIIGSVYCIECFPQWAGPVLVNAASFRNIVGFGISFGVTDWVVARGYMGCFGIFAGVIAFVSLGVVVLFIFGKRMRKSTNILVKKTDHSS